ncbi:hypothetical protein [Bacillus sp. FSL R9-9410]
MFSSKKDRIKDYLEDEGYKVKEYLYQDGDWYHFKVNEGWGRVLVIRVKETVGFFSGAWSYLIEKL